MVDGKLGFVKELDWRLKEMKRDGEKKEELWRMSESVTFAKK